MHAYFSTSTIDTKDTKSHVDVPALSIGAETSANDGGIVTSDHGVAAAASMN